jgi:hypothetical protein
MSDNAAEYDFIVDTIRRRWDRGDRIDELTFDFMDGKGRVEVEQVGYREDTFEEQGWNFHVKQGRRGRRTLYGGAGIRLNGRNKENIVKALDKLEADDRYPIG